MRAQAAENTGAVDDDDPRVRILDAANQCFTQLGIARTSVQDVARMASVSRGTVYRYFEDRNVLIAAAIAHGAAQYYRDVAAAMKPKVTLAEQIGAMAEVVAKTRLEHRVRNRLMADDAELMRHMIADGDDTVRRTSAFLLPYVRAAQQRGEVGPSVDAGAASEWLARIIYSLTSVQDSESFDMTKPRSVKKYVETFAVNGLR